MKDRLAPGVAAEGGRTEGRRPGRARTEAYAGPLPPGSGETSWRDTGPERKGGGPGQARAPDPATGGGRVRQAPAAWSPRERMCGGRGAGPSGRGLGRWPSRMSTTRPKFASCAAHLSPGGAPGKGCSGHLSPGETAHGAFGLMRSGATLDAHHGIMPPMLGPLVSVGLPATSAPRQDVLPTTTQGLKRSGHG